MRGIPGNVSRVIADGDPFAHLLPGMANLLSRPVERTEAVSTKSIACVSCTPPAQAVVLVLPRKVPYVDNEEGGWSANLKPITQEFINAAQGKPTQAFWQNLYKIEKWQWRTVHHWLGGPSVSVSQNARVSM